MIWLAWRQSRGTVIVVLVLLVVILGGLLAVHFLFASALAATGAGPCLSGAAGSGCTAKLGAFLRRVPGVLLAPAYLNLLPPLAGLFIGTPMVAREMERGTFRLAWTQGASRGRWFAAHVLVSILLVLAVTAATQAALWIVFQPALAAQQILGQSPIFQPLTFFDVFGLVPVAYTLFALGLGISAGALLHRTIGAMLVVLVVFAGARAGIGLIRPHFMRPLRAYDVSALYPRPHSTLDGALIVTEVADPHAPVCTPPAKGSTPKNFVVCPPPPQDITYQPASRFWPFQMIESAIYLTLTLLLLAGSALLVRWRRV